MANNTVTLTGGNSGLIYDGKKTISVTNSYSSNSVSLTGTLEGYKEGKEAGSTIDGSFAATKVGIIEATGTSKTLAIHMTQKGSAYLGSGGGTVYGSSGADKMYGGSKADTFVVNKGDAIGDAKAAGYDKNDTIVLEDASVSSLTFTDNFKNNSVVVTNGKDKTTIFKDASNPQLNIKTGKDSGTVTYGVDGKKTSADTSGKTLTITSSATEGETFDAHTIMAGAKNIDASAATKAIKLVGNNTSNAITIGSGGGTLYGGYDTAKNKATNDNLYGTEKGAVTFLVDSLGGNDNIYNYKEGDTIVIADGKTASLDFTNSKAFKDGGTGKDISVTYNGNSKIAIKANTANKITFSLSGGVQTYGVDMPDGVSLDSKRTSLVVTGNKLDEGAKVSIDGWTDSSGNNALKTFAPKLNTIDATAATRKYYLEGQASIASILKSGAKGASMSGGTAADQFYGGDGADAFIVDAATLTGKDVINDYGAKDIIIVKHANSTVHSSLGADAISLDSKGVLYFSDDKTDQKNSSITVKNFKNTDADSPVVVVDENGKILAVNSNDGVPTPNGLTNAKTGLITDAKYNGQYARDTYAKGAIVEVSTGKLSTDANIALTLEGSAATLDANTYGGTAKQINASVVGSGLTSMVIIGNENAKNTIYTPVKTKGDILTVTVEGGAQNDTFIGNSTATLTNVFYNMSANGKDVIQGYNEDDTVYIDGVTLTAGDNGYVNDSRLYAKGTDVVFEYKDAKKNTITLKNAAAKKITVKDANGSVLNFGYSLKDGLVYDTKRTAITGTAALEGSVYIDLTQSSMGADIENGFFDPGVKTVNLASATSVESAAVIGNTLANELYAAPQGSKLYGGPNAAKPIADKLYGNTGADVFYYQEGDGADVIGNAKVESTRFDEKDILVLASKNDSALTKDDITFTDKKNVLTLTFGTDKTKFTVNKKAAATPVQIALTSSLSGEIGEVESETFIYGVDTEKFQADTTNIEKGRIDITGAGTLGTDATTGELEYAKTTAKRADGGTDELKLAEVDVRYVNSGLKNIGVNIADTDTAVSLTGGVSALNVTMGAGGGTVEGGYSITNGKAKTFNDKFYANADAKRGTTFVLDKTYGGKDMIYNYDASRGDVLYFADGAPTEVKYSKTSLTIGYDSKNTFVLNTTSANPFTDTTNVHIIYTVEGGVVDKTYYGWSADKKTFAAYESFVRDEHWNKDTNNNYIYTGSNSTTNSGDYGTSYTLSGNGIIDANSDYVPDGVTVSQGVISFDNKAETATYLNPATDKFHIKGHKLWNNDNGTTLHGGDTFTANGVTYTLANADGNADNGYELSYNSWVKTGDDSFAYFTPGVHKEDAASEEGPNNDASLGSAAMQFSISGAVSDGASVGAANNVFAKFNVAATSGDNRYSSDVSITVASSRDDTFSMTGTQFVVQGDNSVNNPDNTDITGGNKFALSNKYRVIAKAGTSTLATYKLYDADGDSVNGYELLRTDLAENAGWTLSTAVDADDVTIGAAQTKNTGNWFYSDTKNEIVFQVSVGAGIEVDRETGLPVGISVGAASKDTLTVPDTFKGTIFIDKTEFNTANLIFDSSVTKFGTDTKAVRISGLNAGTTVVVDSGTDKATTYILGEADGNTANGLELLKKNDNWTFDAGAWIYNNKDTRIHTEENITLPALDFTISAAASLRADANGAPIGVSVDSDTYSDTGYVKINFSGMQNVTQVGGKNAVNLLGKDKASDTSLITFGNIETGDVVSSTRIVGFDTDLTTFTINNTGYYLADSDNNEDNGYELLPVNSYWRRKKDSWHYYMNGTSNLTGSVATMPAGDVYVTLQSDTTYVHADGNGAPIGISINLSDGAGTITIDESIGASTVHSAGDCDTSKIYITDKMLHLSSTTAVNASGVHILGQSTKAKEYFNSDTTFEITYQTGQPRKFKLAQLDRSTVNGFELLSSDTTGSWTYNNGVLNEDKTGYNTNEPILGSWTYNSGTKIGNSDSLVFTINEAASLLPVDGTTTIGTVKVENPGNPDSVYVSLQGTEAFIYVDGDNLKSNHFEFGDSDTAKKLFLSDTGVHFFGLEENDTLSVTGAVSGSGEDATTETVVYRVKELSNATVDGMELLRVTDGDKWSLNVGTAGSGNNAKLYREWTYSGLKVTLSTGADTAGGDLVAQEDGRPLNLNIVESDTGHATIYVNQETDTTNYPSGQTSLLSGQITITSALDNFGSDGTLHITGFDSNTTVYAVDNYDGADTGRYYRLANLDSNDKDLEFIAYNANWRYYDSDASAIQLGRTGETYTSGTWVYNLSVKDGNANKTFYMAFDSDAGVRSTSESTGAGVVAADSLGAPDGVTVETGSKFSNIILTFDSSKLNIDGGKNSSHILFGSDTGIGKNGIHIKGFDTGTTVTFSVGTATDVYLAELYGDTSDGYELLRVNSNWKRTANGWYYSDSDTSKVNGNNKKLGFSVNKILDVDDATGAPIGISVQAGASDSDTILVDTKEVAPDQIFFDNGVKVGESGIHISLSGNSNGWIVTQEGGITFKFQSESDTTETNSTDLKGFAGTFIVRELDGKTDNGYELLTANSDGWSMANGTGTSATQRIWTYNHAVGSSNEALTFTVKGESGKDGLKSYSDTGAPIGVSVATDTMIITFKDTDTTANAGKVALRQVTFTSAPTGVNGVHITGLADSDTELAYTTDTSSMTTINKVAYYLADVNTETNATGFELLKYDANWHRYKNGWTYKNNATNPTMQFTLNSDTALLEADGTTNTDKKGALLGASTVTADEGKPAGISVSGGTIYITSESTIADFLVFSGNTKVDALHVSVSGDSNPNSAVNIFRFQSGNDTALYYAVDVDATANNGKELFLQDTVTTDGVWTRTSDGWDYFTSDATVNKLKDSPFAFHLAIKGSTVAADNPGGNVPKVKVDSSTSTVSTESGVGNYTLQLFKDIFSTKATSGTTKHASTAQYFSFDSDVGHFSTKFFSEGAPIDVITVDDRTTVENDYKLYNADGDSSNGLELTYNGWTTYTSDTNTIAAYVKGTNATATSNQGFAIYTTGESGKPLTITANASLPGFASATSSSFSLRSADNAADGVVMANLNSDNFHVIGKVNDQGNIAEGSVVSIGGNKYKLKDLDTTKDGIYELVSSDGNWAKHGAASYKFVGPNSETAKLMVTGGSNTDMDTGNDFVPDLITKITYDDTNKLQITISGTNSELRIKTNSVDLSGSKVTYNGSSNTYELKAEDNEQYSYSIVEKTTTPQLAADSAQAWSGYDVEDLVNYDNTASFDSELDSILKPTEIGTAETFGTDPADLLMGVATKDKSLLASVARHRARK